MELEYFIPYPDYTEVTQPANAAINRYPFSKTPQHFGFFITTGHKFIESAETYVEAHRMLKTLTDSPNPANQNTLAALTAKLDFFKAHGGSVDLHIDDYLADFPFVTCLQRLDTVEGILWAASQPPKQAFSDLDQPDPRANAYDINAGASEPDRSGFSYRIDSTPRPSFKHRVPPVDPATTKPAPAGNPYRESADTAQHEQTIGDYLAEMMAGLDLPKPQASTRQLAAYLDRQTAKLEAKQTEAPAFKPHQRPNSTPTLADYLAKPTAKQPNSTPTLADYLAALGKAPIPKTAPTTDHPQGTNAHVKGSQVQSIEDYLAKQGYTRPQNTPPASDHADNADNADTRQPLTAAEIALAFGYHMTDPRKASVATDNPYNFYEYRPTPDEQDPSQVDVQFTEPDDDPIDLTQGENLTAKITNLLKHTADTQAKTDSQAVLNGLTASVGTTKGMDKITLTPEQKAVLAAYAAEQATPHQIPVDFEDTPHDK